MKLDPSDLIDLRPLLVELVRTTLAEAEANGQKLKGHLAYNEAEAAALLGIAKHALRDLRLAGEVEGSKLGARIVYQREELLRLLVAKKV